MPSHARRGTAIDDWFSDRFLSRQAGAAGYLAGDLQGSVVETVTRLWPARPELAERIGGPGSVGRVVRMPLEDVLSDLPGEPADGAVCALHLQFVPDLTAGVNSVLNLVRAGGVALFTIPAIGPLSRERDDALYDRWRPTPMGFRRLLEALVPAENIRVQSFGNLAAATAHLYGFKARDLTRVERELQDEDFPVVVAARVKVP